MEYFSSLKSAFVGPSESQQTEAEIVEKLVERVISSNSIDDRRDACRALRSLSKKYRVQVGAQGMEALLTILEQDRSDSEIITYALDALSNVICGIVDVDGELDYSAKVENIGNQFTEIYLKKVENVKLLLEILEDPDMQVKWACVKLLTALLINKPKEVQEYIISSPNGVSRLMDNLMERRDIIRNDTLFLLAHLTKGNANIQKIVAFQNAFDILFDIIGKEGYCDGGMVIEDALVVMCNLLKNNTSNQIFFKEGSFIQKLKNFFDLHLDLGGPDKGWHDQRRTNIILMLQVTRLLVSTNNPHHIISSCQKIMYRCGLLEKLCTLLMAAGVPVDVLTDTVVTVAEVIRGNLVNQEYFSTLNAPSSPPSPAIVVLLMSMMNDRQPFSLRCAVLFCFQSFLHKNELGQAQIVQTLLPSSADDATATAGQFLCGGLFVSEPLSNWLASVALSHTLIDNITQKEQLLRVQLTTSMGKLPVYLLKHCSTILQQGGKPQMKIGLLILLCTWLSHCHIAVTQFLDIPINVPYLTSQIGINESDEYEILVQGMCSFLLGICVEFNDNTVASFKRHDLCQLIVKRVKLETFLNKLSSISKHESYCKAVQKPIIKFCEPSDLLFDYEFCNLFKSLEGVVISAVTPKPIDLDHGPECTMSPSQLSLLQEYKDVIRNQDQLLSSLNSEIGTLEVSKNKTSLSIQEMTNIIQQLRDQNALLKAHNAFSCGSGDNITKHEELVRLKQEFEKLKHEYQTIQNEAAEKSCILEKLMLDAKSDVPEVDRKLQPTTDEFLKAIEEQNNEIQQLKHTILNLESQLDVLKSQNENYKTLIEEKNEILAEYEDAKDQLSLLQNEQEDLHILIADQSTQLSMFRHRLKELGEPVDEEAEDDLDLTEFEDNNEELFKKTT